MDIEFIVQDVFALTRPQWKLASNIEEASKAFQLAMAQDQKTSGMDKVLEAEAEADDSDSSDDDMGDIGLPPAEVDGDSESDDEVDVGLPSLLNKTRINFKLKATANGDNGDNGQSAPGTDSEEESIVVTREEEEVDPEDEADFDRELAKLMAESLDSRKHERKPTFDVPLPMRRKENAPNPGTPGNESWTEESTSGNANTGTMAFSLLTKRGNRQQVGIVQRFSQYPANRLLQTRTVALPSDSNFAIAMKTKQAADREEQKRIKDLVLNYEIREGEEQDGDSTLAPLNPNYNIHGSNTGLDKAAGMNFARADRSGNTRAAQRTRKLQLSDVDWYDKPTFSHVETKPSAKKGSCLTSGPRNRPGQSAAPPDSQRRVIPPARATGQCGRLIRKAMLAEHAARAGGEKPDSKK